jgi:NH3-dependent NAD+ synthetase
MTDEDRLGMKYADVDKFIRTYEGDMVLVSNILSKYHANKFKLDMIHIEGPKFKFLPNFVKNN